MKFWTSIFRRERPPRSAREAPRKRPGRSFAATLASLEHRSLLTLIGPVASPVTVAIAEAAPIASTEVVTIAPTEVALPDNPTAPPDSFSIGSQASGVTTIGYAGISGTVAAPGSGVTTIGYASVPLPPPGGQNGPGSAGGTSIVQVQGGGSPQGSQQVGQPPPHGDRITDHVSLAVAAVKIGGVPTPEFALANAGDNKVVVKVGSFKQVFGPSDGINDPQAVALGDLNGDGIPDLVVANSGANNVLVFPGLPGGLFGPAVNGVAGFQAGSDPVGVTINDFNHELLVTNKDSNSVSILQGQGTWANWTETVASTIENVGLAPVKAALFDLNNDGQPDLFVCNSGSDTVAMYRGLPGGTFDTSSPTIFGVGTTPSDMLIGQFDRRSQLDLVTVNAGSNDVTFVGGVFTSHPTIQTYSSGGTLPDAALALPADPSHSKVMDLVVANGGDGHVALLQAANEGMQLTTIITQADLPVPTGLAPASSSGAGLDFYAASAGQDAAQLLHFDLGTFPISSSSTLLGSASVGQGNDDLTAGLMQYGESGLELIAVFWGGNSDFSEIQGGRDLHESSVITTLYSPTEGQGIVEPNANTEVVNNPGFPQALLPNLSKVDALACFPFVSGIDAAWTAYKGFIEVVSARDIGDPVDDRPIEELARREPDPLGLRGDPDAEDDPNLLEETLRLFRSEGRPFDRPEPAEPDRRSDSAPSLEGVDAPALERPLDSVPMVSSALLLAGRLILKASPPRPPSFRKGTSRRGFSESGDALPDQGRPIRP